MICLDQCGGAADNETAPGSAEPKVLVTSADRDTLSERIASRCPSVLKGDQCYATAEAPVCQEGAGT